VECSVQFVGPCAEDIDVVLHGPNAARF
jgi:hypothetical protein